MAKLAHVRMHRLGREEVMAQIDVLGLVPIGDVDRGNRVPLVVGGIVDQHRDRTEPLARVSRSRAAAASMSVTSACRKITLWPPSVSLPAVPLPRLFVDVDEGDPAAVEGEGAHDLRADAVVARRSRTRPGRPGWG